MAMIRFLRTVSSHKLQGVALVRLDFNTEDEWRMEATLPTLRFLLGKKVSKIVIVSHRGRPQGVEKKFSLKKDAKNLSRLLQRDVVFVSHFRFSEMKDSIDQAPEGSIFLLENLRFLKGEEDDDVQLAEKLAGLADYYVNDAFAVSHRDDASVDAITRFLPSYGGLELELEIKNLSRVMKQAEQPLVIIFGGGKAHDKLPVIHYFKNKAETFILGGAVANTLLRERGFEIRGSVADEHPDPVVKKIERYQNILLPVDFVWEKGKILDCGPKSVALFAKKIRTAKTIIWNGPFGLIEKKKFARGTCELIKVIARNKKAFRVAGGGETVMFVKENKLDKAFDFVSTGGGAMLAYLAGEKLPGIEALKRKASKKK